jgi:CMP-N-acetylneuraminic acid synthetase
MSQNEIVAFVPIKLNSQRLKNKNILDFSGKPLMYYVFQTLLKCNHISDVYVYCSNEKVMSYIPSGVKFLKRDERLDGDFVKGLDIYKAFKEDVKADIYVLAHATSPFTTKRSIDIGIEKVLLDGFDSAFSARKEQTFIWYDGLPLNYQLDDVPRTQDISPIFVETSGFYIYRSEVIDKSRRIGENPFICEVSHIEGIDIDTEDDFIFAQKIAETERKRK